MKAVIMGKKICSVRTKKLHNNSNKIDFFNELYLGTKSIVGCSIRDISPRDLCTMILFKTVLFKRISKLFHPRLLYILVKKDCRF